MKILEKFALIEEVATKLAELHDAKKVNDFLDEFNLTRVDPNIDVTLKEHALLRLKGIEDDQIIHMAKHELDMDLSKFKSIDEEIPF